MPVSIPVAPSGSRRADSAFRSLGAGKKEAVRQPVAEPRQKGFLMWMWKAWHRMTMPLVGPIRDPQVYFPAHPRVCIQILDAADGHLYVKRNSETDTSAFFPTTLPASDLRLDSGTKQALSGSRPFPPMSLGTKGPAVH